MFKPLGNTIKLRAGNKALLLRRLSFLLAIGLWFWGFHDATDSVGDIIAEFVVAVIAGALTFELVAVGVLICLIPFIIAYRAVADALRNSDG